MPALRRWSMPHWVRWEHSGPRFHWGNALRRWYGNNTLPCLWGVYRETFGCTCHLFVADGSGSDGFQRINPTVAHTVGELFFLPPGNVLREHVGKGFADYFLFYLLAGAHLDCRIDAHGNIQEFFVEEGDTSFHSPGCKAFVGTEAVVQM